jgi:hypothetical protein
LTLSQNNPTVMNNLAMAYAMMGDPKKAEEILRQAATSQGASPKVRENLALVLGLQGRYDESKAVAAGVLNTEVASANTAYLQQMVKLEPKNDMPDATSFASNTSVEPVPVQQAVQSTPANASPMPVAQSAWQTMVGETASITTVKAEAEWAAR